MACLKSLISYHSTLTLMTVDLGIRSLGVKIILEILIIINIRKIYFFNNIITFWLLHLKFVKFFLRTIPKKYYTF